MFAPTTGIAAKPPAGWRRPAGLGAIAAAALLLGLVVYLSDRPSASALLIPRFEAFGDRQLFGVVGQWLPSFLHPLAFSLLTAAALPSQTAPRYGVCMVWGLVNLGFEVGQHAATKGLLASALLEVFGRAPPARWLADYFLNGTFDIGDVIAAVLGALAAAALLGLAGYRPEQHHAP